jgi:hypothetical protein
VEPYRSRSIAWPRLQQNDAALVTVWTAPANLGLKREISFLYFRENIFSLFAKKLQKSCENIHFREKFFIWNADTDPGYVSSTKTLVDGT